VFSVSFLCFSVSYLRKEYTGGMYQVLFDLTQTLSNTTRVARPIMGPVKHRYISEFQFRYCARKIDDSDRMELAIKNAVGKRLMYKEARAS